MTLILAGCSNNKGTAETAQEEAYTAVEVETLQPTNLYIENIMTAKTYADKDVYVVPLISGKVEKINVSVGDRVSKDQILFVMDKDDIQKQVNQALAAYESAKAAYNVTAEQIKNAKDSFERTKKLYEEGAVPQTTYDQAKLAASDESLDVAQKSVDQAKVSYDNAASALENAEVKAPISGVISAVNIVEGDYATSSNPPITIVDSNSVTVKFGIPSNLVNKIKQGDKAVVEIASADYKEESVIKSVGTVTDPVTNLYNVEILLENDGSIKPGMFAKVHLNTDRTDNVLAVRTEAVIERDGESYVYILNGEDTAAEKKVATGLDTGSYIEIKEGLSEGDKVVISGQDYLNDGSKIKVVRGE